MTHYDQSRSKPVGLLRLCFLSAWSDMDWRRSILYKNIFEN